MMCKAGGHSPSSPRHPSLTRTRTKTKKARQDSKLHKASKGSKISRGGGKSQPLHIMGREEPLGLGDLQGMWRNEAGDVITIVGFDLNVWRPKAMRPGLP